MPTTSPAQERLMRAAAHTRGGYGGVSQKVGREFMGDAVVGKEPPDYFEKLDAAAKRMDGLFRRADAADSRLDGIERSDEQLRTKGGSS